MITAIVLAAGESQRMGAQKVLLPYGDSTVIEHIVRTLEHGGADSVIVVTGHKDNRVLSALQNTGAAIAFNKEYLTGMLSSVR
ncbi:MAG: NTP transferase domain-containing protein, partial [Pirellulaceae bacterium]|nr:NTP transferase domain-containing protein [Pirellulaceae bacterium]